MSDIKEILKTEHLGGVRLTDDSEGLMEEYAKTAVHLISELFKVPRLPLIFTNLSHPFPEACIEIDQYTWDATIMLHHTPRELLFDLLHEYAHWLGADERNANIFAAKHKDNLLNYINELWFT